MVISVYAPDSAKDFEEYDKFMRELAKVLLEGRTEGARRFFFSGDLNVELGLLGMDEDEEMQEFYGPQWRVQEDDVAGSYERN